MLILAPTAYEKPIPATRKLCFRPASALLAELKLQPLAPRPSIPPEV